MSKKSAFKNVSGNPRGVLFFVLVFVVGMVVLARLTEYARTTQEVDYTTFMKHVDGGLIKEAYIDGQDVQGALQDGSHVVVVVPEGSSTSLADYLRAKDVRVVNARADNQATLWYWFLFFALVVLPVGGWFLWRYSKNAGNSGGSGIFGMGKSRAKMFMPMQVSVKFNAVAGADEAKKELQSVVDFLKSPEKYYQIGAKLTRGILLVGEPGNGKTLLAKALAGEANCPFFSVSGSDFIEIFVGIGASRVRDLFAQARKHAPSIIFIDEIDAIGRHRGAGLGGGHDEREQTLNQLLIEMDGLETANQAPVIVVAATNRPDVLDKALLRPGRFDRRIEVPYPDVAAREQIVKICAERVKIDPSVDLKQLAETTGSFSGADIANLVNLAAINASKNGRIKIMPEDIDEARKKIISNHEARYESVKVFVPSQIKVTFDDVAGADEAKEDLIEVVDFLKNPDRYAAFGAKIPHGVLLTGEPGNGKTLLARAVAGEANCTFLVANGSEFIEKYVGVGASRVRELFEAARRQAPSIIFIDEIDSFAVKRDEGQSEHTQTLNQLLTEMDGFTRSKLPVVVIGATNRMDMLDKALLRPGRFDRKVYVPYPSLADREKILKVHAKGIRLDDKVDLYAVAQGTPGFTGADLANLLNEAAIVALKRSALAVGVQDIDAARDKILLGRESKSVLMTEQERTITAYHEAGHALVRLVLPEYADPLYKVTIIPRGQALGVTHSMPERDTYMRSREQLLTSIMSALGGRAAEELVFNNIGTGAASDFKNATQTATAMVRSYGMSERLGMVAYDRHCSQETERLIEDEVRHIIDDSYKKTMQLLKEHRDKLEKLSQELLIKETLFAHEIYILLGLEPRKDHRLIREEEQTQVEKTDN